MELAGSLDLHRSHMASGHARRNLTWRWLAPLIIAPNSLPPPGEATGNILSLRQP